MITWAGVLGIVGGLLALVGSWAPYATYTISSTSKQSVAIFSPGSGVSASYLWFVTEPAAVIALGILGGVLLLAKRQGRMPVIAASGLTVMGFQSLLLFAGYALGSQGNSQIGPGGPIAMVGAAVLLAGGLIGLAGLARRDSAQDTTGQAAQGAAAAGAGLYPPQRPGS